MVDKYTNEKMFDLELNSNKVVNIKDKYVNLNFNEPTGEAETLVGKKLHKFGDLAQHSKPPILKRTKINNNNNKNELFFNNNFINFSKNLSEDILYKPKTKDTQNVYDELLNLIQNYLKDQPSIFIESALDSVIAIVKTTKNEDEKKKELNEILGKQINNDELNKLNVLCKDLVDYDMNFNNDDNNENNENVEMNVEIIKEDENEDEKDEFNLIEEEEKSEKENEIDINIDDLNINNNNNNNDDEIEMDERKGILSQNKNEIILTIESVLNNKFWLQNFLREKLKIDDNILLNLETEILNILILNDLRLIENKLVQLLNIENFEFIKFLIQNKNLIYFNTKLNKSQNSQEIQEILNKVEIIDKELFKILSNPQKNMKKKKSKKNKTTEKISHFSLENLDLNDLAFENSGHFNSNKKIVFPEGTFKQIFQNFQEITIPPQKKIPQNLSEFPIKNLPEWMHRAFQIKTNENKLEFINKTFNKVQSKVLSTALNTDENLLICAPTSSGKTNIALFTILRLISLNRNEQGIKTNNIKIVYIAPMKALVKELVGNLSQRLSYYNLNVKELSGDVNLTKHEISQTNLIITTPEKFDIITRKSGVSFDSINLLIIDEIHLLHDSRGAVLESIVARILINDKNEETRIVALSATLPNYKDVANFCHVNLNKGLFYFDSSFRPIPLKQLFVGITEKKGIKKLILINEIAYNKIIERLNDNKQIIVFVHSRRETLNFAKYLIEQAKKNGQENYFKLNINKVNEFNTILQDDLDNNLIKNKELLDLFNFSIGIHHAGMNINDKIITEEYFNNGYLKVIISTATLAWGVNLPAHTVIIKGTQIYNPEIGQWSELSFLDVMQMMGRAGRVGYINDKENLGEGIIITSFQELQFYLSLLNQSLPIESQLIKNLPDCLNAEIVSGMISSINDGVKWLSQTYLYIRMLKSPNVYNITDEEIKEDKTLLKRRSNLIHSAALLLQKNNLIKYNIKTGELSPTQLGKVSSYYYIKYPSIGTYNQNLNENMSEIDIFRLFSLSQEFSLIPIREEEKKEIEKLMYKVPIPIKGSLEESSTKINILLQCYISNIKLENYAISSDMIFISQNAGRIFRALFEITCNRAWANVSYNCLKICKEISNRMWNSMTPLRQFKLIPDEIIHKIEGKEQLTWERFFDLTVDQIGDILKIKKNNSQGIFRLLETFPKLEISANIQPLSRNCLFVEVVIQPKFAWIKNYHKYNELFHLFVEDNDSEIILHHEMFGIKEKNLQNEKRINFIVPIINPVPPQYFIRIISDSWINCEKTLPIYFKYLVLPEKFPPFSKLYELSKIEFDDNLFEKDFNDFYKNEKKFKFMNEIQTQIFREFNDNNNNNDSVFIGAPVGSGKSFLAESFMIKHFEEKEKNPMKKNIPILFVCYNNEILENKYSNLKKLFKNKIINKFTGETILDRKLFDLSEIILSTFEKIEFFSRKNLRNETFKNLELIIIDGIHLINNDDCNLEIALNRIRYLTNENKNKLKFVVLSTSLSNPDSICEWLNIKNVFNFEPKVRPTKTEFFFFGYESISHKFRMNLMSKNIFNLIIKYSFFNNNDNKLKSAFKLSTIIFVSNIKNLKSLMLNFINYLTSTSSEINSFIINKISNFKKIILDDDLIKTENDELLINSLKLGMGYIHEGMSQTLKSFIQTLFDSRIIQILVVTHKCLWSVNTFSHNVIIADTVKFDNDVYVDYNVTEMLQMVGRASITYSNSVDEKNFSVDVQNSTRKIFVLLNSSKKEFYKKFLIESFPLESSLNNFLHNTFLTEIFNGIIKNKQECLNYLTWSFFYRRLEKNPNYYELKGKNKSDLNEFLSVLVENVLNDLEKNNMIFIENNNLKITNLGKCASFYCVGYDTINLLNNSFEEIKGKKTKLQIFFEIVKNCFEFDFIEINKNDVKILNEIVNENVNNKNFFNFLTDDIKKIANNNNKNEIAFVLSDPHNKTLILLLCYFNRIYINPLLNKDLEKIILIMNRIILSLVDILSSKNMLKECLLAMQISQMIIQAMFINQNTLMQLPYFTNDLIKKCLENKINDINDLMNMNDKERNELLKDFDEEKMNEIAEICNRYPSIEMKYKLSKKVLKLNEINNVSLQINLVRDIDDDVNVLSNVHSEFFPGVKEENWWIVVCLIKSEKNKEEVQIDKIVCIKRINFCKKLNVDVNIQVEKEIGKFEYKIYLICDSWVGCDFEESFNIQIKE